jgi:DNA-binding NtrC family response regulator
MRVHLLENEPEFRDALSQDLIALDIQVDCAEPPDIEDLEGWHPNADVVILGQHALANHLAQLSKCIWPTPVASLLPVHDTRHIMRAAREGALDAFDRASPVSTIAAGLNELCQQQAKLTSGDRSRQHYVSEFCAPMQTLQDHIGRVARTDSTVLIIGETGTGKELAAREVHRIGARADQPVVPVNCAAIPDTLIESELFGYEKGAFTGATSNRVGLIEAADGGTLFLDEIGELPLAAQARLLRFMQEGEIRRIGSVTSKKVDVRLICATHRDLSALASRNEFRQDLFYRVDVLRLNIPPLRDRGDDVLAMANWFVEQQSHKLGIPAKPLSKNSQMLLEQHHWPGNVRELQNVIERALVMSTGPTLQLTLSTSATPTAMRKASSPEVPQPSATAYNTDSAEELSLEDYFQRFVLEHQDAMNETELAQKLGISRKCLWERRQRFGLPRQKQKRA